MLLDIQNSGAVSVETNSPHSLMGDANMLLPVDSLGLTIRTLNALKEEKINPHYQILYIGQLLAQSKNDLLRRANFGEKSLMEISAKLAERGYRLFDAYNVVGKLVPPARLRDAYQIAEDVEAPTDWSEYSIPPAIVEVPKAKPLSKEFSATMFIEIPHVLNGEKTAGKLEGDNPVVQKTHQKIKTICQRAFEIAVQNDFMNGFRTDKIKLKDALKAQLAFDEVADARGANPYDQGHIVRFEVTLAPEHKDMINNNYLKGMVQSLSYTKLIGFVAPAFKPANGPQ